MKRNVKPMVLAALVLAGMLSTAGCSQKDAQTQADTQAQAGGADSATVQESEKAPGTSAGEGADEDLLAQIRKRGKLIVAMEGTWSPWTYHDENDQLVGYDVEVAQKLGEKLGVEVDFAEGEWDGLFAGLDAGRYDMVVNGVEITEERAQKYDFSSPYAYIRTAVIVKEDNDEIQSFEDLAGKNTANTISSTYAELAESYGAKVTGVDDLNQTFELLLSGRIDATLNAELTYYDYRKAHPEENIKIAALTDDASLVAIPVRKGEDTASLRQAVDEAISQLAGSGELAELSQKYFGSDITKAP